MDQNHTISSISKALLVVASCCLIASLFVPIWSISLDAPQYPEGLGLQIWAGKLAGDVEIINGLNHYIGMKTLHNDDFVEFTLLPFIIVVYALLFLWAAVNGKRKLLYLALAAFIIFGMFAMIDFWKWEYDYGHNLDPNAAIKVPGMAYQPPLLGFKQLLNFGAYSVPDIGGWLFIAAGLLLIVSVYIEMRRGRHIRPGRLISVAAIISALLFSCGNTGPVPIQYNKDACEFCKMSISDSRFATEWITSKGRVYKYDDMACMLAHSKERPDTQPGNYYTGGFLKGDELISAEKAFFVRHETIKSPMGGGIAAFLLKEQAAEYAQQCQVKVLTWASLKSELEAE